MKQGDFPKRAAKNIKGILNKFLNIDANSTSCVVIYQPKAPKELSTFKKINNGIFI